MTPGYPAYPGYVQCLTSTSQSQLLRRVQIVLDITSIEVIILLCGVRVCDPLVRARAAIVKVFPGQQPLFILGEQGIIKCSNRKSYCCALYPSPFLLHSNHALSSR